MDKKKRHRMAERQHHHIRNHGIRRHGTAKTPHKQVSKIKTGVSTAVTAGLILGLIFSVYLYSVGSFSPDALINIIAQSPNEDQPKENAPKSQSAIRDDAKTVFPADVEVWRATVKTACEDVELDTKWIDTVLAMMQAESGGDIEINSVVGVRRDIMQAGEGCAGVYAGKRNVVELGSAALMAWDISPSIAFSGNTATASIYAGVIETKSNVDLLEDWLGEVDVSDMGKVGLVAQGYNYGCDGWFAYCRHHGITSWSYEASQNYKFNHGGGTVNHGQKVIDFYEEALQQKADS